MKLVKHTTSPRYQFRAVPARLGSNSLSFSITGFVSLTPPSVKYSKGQYTRPVYKVDTDSNFLTFIKSIWCIF